MRQVLPLLLLICSLGAGAQVPIVQRSALRVTSELPQSVDNSLSKYFPPLIDQKGGSCAQASAIGYMYTYEMNRLLDRDASASPANRFSYQYTYNFVNEGKDNGSLSWEGLSLATDNGVITEEDWPESGPTSFKWATGYEKYLTAIHYRARTFDRIPLEKWEDLPGLKQFLYNRGTNGSAGGLVVFSGYAGNWTINQYDGPSATGYHRLLTQLGTDGGHALTIVGYDDLVEFTTPGGEVSKGAFIVVNTWGSYAHDRGRFYLPYWLYFNHSPKNLLSDFVTSVDPYYQEPQIVFKVGVECDSRDDLSFQIGVAPNQTDMRPTHQIQVSIADHQGGDHPMQGAWWPNDIEFGFDFSKVVKLMDGYDHPAYFLTVSRNKRGSQEATVARLTGLSVYDYRQGTGKTKVHVFDMEEARQEGTVDFHTGYNTYRLSSIPPKKTSFSPVEWISAQTKQPVSAPLVVRTASGKYAKIRLSDYDRAAGTIHIKYVYNPEGGRNLK